jgi:hypothetical protein
MKPIGPTEPEILDRQEPLSERPTTGDFRNLESLGGEDADCSIDLVLRWIVRQGDLCAENTPPAV